MIRLNKEPNFLKTEISGHRPERDKMIKDIMSLVTVYDKNEKALTGRKIEDYELQSGISKEMLFPESAKILNIGDPWQTLDIPGVTSLDYESGDEAEFLKNPETLRKNFEDNIVKPLERIAEVYGLFYEKSKLAKEEDSSIISEIEKSKKCLEKLPRTISIKNISEFDYIGDDIIHASTFFAQVTKNDSGDNWIENTSTHEYFSLKETWYLMQKTARHLKDLYLWQEVIKPKLQSESLRLKGLDEKKEQEIIQREVAKHRFIKKTKEAQFVKGAWPETHFEDNSFDRFTASWSISAHIFQRMNTEQLEFSFEEIARVLNKQGIAFIWPMNYYWNEYDNLIEATNKFCGKSGDVGIVIDSDLILFSENPSRFQTLIYNNEAKQNNFTLVLFKSKPKKDMVEKLRNSLVSHPTDKFEFSEDSIDLNLDKH